MGLSLSGRDDDLILQQLGNYLTDVFENIFSRYPRYNPGDNEAHTIDSHSIPLIFKLNQVDPALFVLASTNLEPKYYHSSNGRITEYNMDGRFTDMLVLALKITNILDAIKKAKAEKLYEFVAGNGMIILRKKRHGRKEFTSLSQLTVPVIEKPYVEMDGLDIINVNMYSSRENRFGVCFDIEKKNDTMKHRNIGFGFGKYIFEEDVDYLGQPYGLPKSMVIFSEEYMDNHSDTAFVSYENYKIINPNPGYVKFPDYSDIGADLICSLIDWNNDYEHKLGYIDDVISEINTNENGSSYLAMFLDKYGHSQVKQEAFMNSWMRYYFIDSHSIVSGISTSLILDIQLQEYVNSSIKEGGKFYFHRFKARGRDLLPESPELDWDFLGISRDKNSTYDLDEKFYIAETAEVEDIRVFVTNMPVGGFINYSVPATMLKISLKQAPIDQDIRVFYINKATEVGYKFAASTEYNTRPGVLDEIIIL